jgi:nicotinamide riboside transporter PnuC
LSSERENHGSDPLARALRTQKVGRVVLALTLVTLLCFTPAVFELVDRLAPGGLPIWIILVWITSIVSIALAVERRPSQTRNNAGLRRGRGA